MTIQPKIAAVLTCTALIGACGDIQTQQQAGDGIAPPSASEMNAMANTAYRYHLRNEPSKLRVNSLQVSNALALFPGDRSDYVVCVQWEAERLGTSYRTDRLTGEITGIAGREGDKYTAYGAFVARLEDGQTWQAVLFERGHGKIGSTPVTSICQT